MAASKKTAKKAAKKTAKSAAPKKAAKKTAAKALKKATAKKKAAKKGRKISASSAADILGLAPTKSAKKTAKAKPARHRPAKIRVKTEWKKYYEILVDLRNRLTHQMDDLKKESAEEMAGYSMHMADSGTDNFDRDSALSLLSSDQDAVYEIDEALKRIEKDTFGICELTGKNIPKTRLNAVPWARYTVEAQAQLEKDGAIRHRKLGSLGTIDGTGGSKTAVADSADSEIKPAKSKK